MRACHQMAGLWGKQLEQKFPQYARFTICMYVKMPISDITPYKNTRKAEKLNSIDERILLRKNAGNFTSRHMHV